MSVHILSKSSKKSVKYKKSWSMNAASESHQEVIERKS
jgi:hypothetical protein